MFPCKPGRGKKPELSSEELKALIMKVARKHFAMQGFNGASLKDIAKEAGIANSLINYHFKDKAGLFRASIVTIARDRMGVIKRILGEPRSRDEIRVRIDLFVQEMISHILAEPEIFEIVDREIRSGNPEIMQLFEETMLENFKAVMEFFRQAQVGGFIREDANPMVLASILFTSTCDSARKEVIAKRFFNVSFKEGEWRNEFSRNLVELFMHGVLK